MNMHTHTTTHNRSSVSYSLTALPVCLSILHLRCHRSYIFVLALVHLCPPLSSTYLTTTYLKPQTHLPHTLKTPTTIHNHTRSSVSYSSETCCQQYGSSCRAETATSLPLLLLLMWSSCHPTKQQRSTTNCSACCECLVLCVCACVCVNIKHQA